MVNKAHFDANYVESLPPIERQLYLIYYTEENKKDQPQDTNVNKTIGKGIEPPIN